LPDDVALLRERYLAAASDLVVADADADQLRNWFELAVGDARAERIAASYALGWLDPAVLDPAGHPADAAAQAAVLLGLVRRLDDLSAAALLDDARLASGVHQMLGARLADSVSLTSALTAALDRMGVREDAALARGVLALAVEAAFEACERASWTAQGSVARARVDGRREWLTATYSGGVVLALLDEVAGTLAAGGS